MKSHNRQFIVEAADSVPSPARGVREITAACNKFFIGRGVPTFDFQPRLQKKGVAEIAIVPRRSLSRFSK